MINICRMGILPVINICRMGILPVINICRMGILPVINIFSLLKHVPILSVSDHFRFPIPDSRFPIPLFKQKTPTR
ncbi:hypothetical protein [Moorena producens]|uniref:hypothetical protein n=1 Tax=Moorena producens TaxID=1155739 RepID=UPI001E284C7C|nr:hypothetical protein [Moorena producens]